MATCQRTGVETVPSRKTKTCPFCREEIDLLALKCVHCGERVGQPLSRERKLTEDDIGRPESVKVEMSGSIVSAYQQLREMTVVSPEAQKLKPLSTGRARLKTVGYGIVAVVALIGLFLVTDSIVGSIFDMESNKMARQAESLLADAELAASTGDLITAIKRGNEALAVFSGDIKSKKFVEELRRRLTDTVRSMYETGSFDAALEFCTEAQEADPTNMQLSNMRSDILTEIKRGKVVLKAVTENSARFAKPNGSQVTLEVGTSMADLELKLKSVNTSGGTAVLHDLRHDRDIKFRVGRGPGEIVRSSSSADSG